MHQLCIKIQYLSSRKCRIIKNNWAQTFLLPPHCLCQYLVNNGLILCSLAGLHKKHHICVSRRCREQTPSSQNSNADPEKFALIPQSLKGSCKPGILSEGSPSSDLTTSWPYNTLPCPVTPESGWKLLTLFYPTHMACSSERKPLSYWWKLHPSDWLIRPPSYFVSTPWKVCKCRKQNRKQWAGQQCAHAAHVWWKSQRTTKGGFIVLRMWLRPTWEIMKPRLAAHRKTADTRLFLIDLKIKDKILHLIFFLF